MYKIGLLSLLFWLPVQSFAYCSNSTSSVDTSHNKSNISTGLDSSPLCVSNLDTTLLQTSYSAKLPEFNFAETNTTSKGSYWSDWGLKYHSEPFISDQYSFGHLGFGIWDPNSSNGENLGTTYKTTTFNGQNNIDIASDPEAWVMNHGVQLSLGFGNKLAGQPRVRFDYLWHENSDDNVSMQVEFPF
ncbi:hypothetical protein [Vibrio marisflavi]|uniref:Outer membrane protein beta-barrel domain-containing protein n=1 Tax=Vibrio marisflavi CECT 7928 TaxID=634439 RepID=A0ABN8DXS9_9VIBR|nr:hypothetical protein [Vibrio marisflavi]CAH0536342.1 hypothetical protein VMF7928_00354 [Vibrio marisflavi CECT 7928]